MNDTKNKKLNVRLCCEPLSSFLPPSLYHFATSARRDTGQKAMSSFSNEQARLKGSFSVALPIHKRTRRGQVI